MKGCTLAALFMCLVSANAFAEWNLVNEESSINYVSIKKSKVGEHNKFGTINGSISKKGEVDVNIDLSSVETNIEIRNKRMRELFFNIASFAEARVKGNVDLSRAKNLSVGGTYTDSIKFTLALHGLSKEVECKVKVIKLADGKLFISSIEPVLINAGDFGLAEGVEKLRLVAKLPSISSVVPVTFNLTFKN